MKKLIINCKTGKKEYVDLTPEEEKKNQERIDKAIEKEAKEDAKAEKKKAALERLKKSKNKDLKDLLLLLGEELNVNTNR